MNYAINPNGGVTRDDGACIPEAPGNRDWDNYLAWVADGNTATPVPPPTFDDYVAAFTPGLQQWMEDTAKDNAYDSVLSCVSYANSSVVQFAQDAQAMIDWRDALWRWASAYQVGAGGVLPDPIPTLEQIIALAPQPATFGWVVHPKGVIISAHENPPQES